MISRDECAAVAEELRGAPGVRRVLFCRHDGVPHHDDAALEQRAAGAALVSGLVGAATVVAQQFAVGETQGVIVYGADAQLIARAVDADLIMVVVADVGGPGQEVYRRVRSVARRMGAAAAH